MSTDVIQRVRDLRHPDADQVEEIFPRERRSELLDRIVSVERSADVPVRRLRPGRHRGSLLSSQEPRPIAPPRRKWRRAPLAYGGLTAGAAALAATLVLSAGTSSPAFALTQNADGSVTLTINELVGVNAANEELAKLGIRARVARYEAGCTATGETVATPATPILAREPYPAQAPGIVQHMSGDTGADVWRINPSAIPAGDTLSLIATKEPAPRGGGYEVESFRAALYSGAAPACFPAPTEG